ncbi:MAG: glucosamine-6-phosphate deaminase [Bacteroidales bacterium]|nr:glucosamine-6-phosphate deaminase [Bacteroidales bacterium]
MIHIKPFKEKGLVSGAIPEDVLHAYEHIPVTIFEDVEEITLKLAELIVTRINESEKVPFKLGISNGSTLVSLLHTLAEMYKQGRVSFKNVELFTTDEYFEPEGIKGKCRTYALREELISKVDILPENLYLLDKCKDAASASLYCSEFDAKSRGLDLLVLGVSDDGQVALNEVGASDKSRTRVSLLSYHSRKRLSADFGGVVANTPHFALTMGVSTLLRAREIYLMAFGEDKAPVVKQIAEGEINNMPATYLQYHKNIHMLVDENAAAMLTREATPWKVGPCIWSNKLIRSAVVWLCKMTGKPVLKLTNQDYLENYLGELVRACGPFDSINIKVFNDLQHTITGWPGGKPNVDDSTRPVSSTPYPKKVVVFSPHPDDDVISMGGTLTRLVEQGHDVYVAYETSGNIAVHDAVVMQHIDAVKELGFGDMSAEIKALIDSKEPHKAEPRKLLDIKGAIRRSEARAALLSIGINIDTNVFFLNLPFYETGGVKKNPCSQADIDIIKELLQKIKPDQIFMAGDLADPHGTHRVCSEAALNALYELRDEEWVQRNTVWLYRGAWMEWEPGIVDMAVPLSPDELIHKRHAIFRHLSQKDIVPFPGDDPREFWQRAEERTQNTANLYNSLGMAEYQAMELFVKFEGHKQ